MIAFAPDKYFIEHIQSCSHLVGILLGDGRLKLGVKRANQRQKSSPVP
ncbi:MULTISPECIES: hypothetical protein [Burkholderiaceae]|nr:hypothetical protein [Burkholderia sp. b13]